MQELARAIAEEMGLPQARAKEIVQRVCDGIADALVKEGRIRLGDFGIFEAKTRASRDARNPRTGEKITIPARVVATFRPGAGLRERVGQLKPADRPDEGK